MATQPNIVPPTLEVRNLRFGMDRVPRHWHGGRKSVTAFFNNLSLFFPTGERFFIDSVKAHKHLVDDKRLLTDVARFCAQEGVHGREHIRYNEMLEAQGYPAVAIDKKVERLLKRVSRVLSKRRQLAVTCALEHFTALMGHYLLSDPRLLQGADPVMASLWRWHAAEESEHRAVAYDVYLAAGGSYVERVVTMITTTFTFWALVVRHQALMMKVDGTLWSLREWRDLFVFLFIEPGGMTSLWRHWLDYFRPSFHPLDHDNSDLLEQWKQDYISGRATVASK
jgi:predicted metal-dependent hydrolase